MIHGTATGYSHHGCRCDACTEAARIRQARYRASGPPVYQHGFSAYTNQRCRCDICRAANAAKLREWRARKRQEAAAT
jgi:hypothetical protein